jgi:hypothetical protein
MRKVSALMLLLAFSLPVLGHEDTVFKIAPDGSVQGLPKPWAPAKLKLKFSNSTHQPVQSAELSFSRLTVRLKPCFLKKLNSRSLDHVLVSGSWYHDTRTFPPYISLTFYTAAFDPGRFENDSYSITFSLIDGHVLNGTQMWKPWWGGSFRGKVLSPKELC